MTAITIARDGHQQGFATVADDGNELHFASSYDADYISRFGRL